jgi:hypothetical protein
MEDPRAGQALAPPPPPPLSPCPWIRDTKGAGGGGGVAAGHLLTSYALAGVSHGSDPSDMTICLSQQTDHPSSWGNTPASAPEPEIVLASNNGAGGGGGGRGNQREEAWVRWGGGGVSICVVDFLNVPPP